MSWLASFIQWNLIWKGRISLEFQIDRFYVILKSNFDNETHIEVSSNFRIVISLQRKLFQIVNLENPFPKCTHSSLFFPFLKFIIRLHEFINLKIQNQPFQMMEFVMELSSIRAMKLKKIAKIFTRFIIPAIASSFLPITNSWAIVTTSIKMEVKKLTSAHCILHLRWG